MRLIDADYVLSALSGLNDRENGDEHFLNGIETAQEVIANAPTVGGWISVKDRLPEKNVPVLVWEKQGFAYVDRLEAECAWQIASTHHAIVTHWMPLPEPPEEEE